MCGFAGMRVFHEAPVPRQTQLDQAIKALWHRGPDGYGTYINTWLGLAHTRLSIIDLTDGAKQPMVDPSGRYVIVFNGEIYNYRELATQFLADDSGLNRSSDTAILLSLFIRMGPDCLQHLNGMFAFAIVDLKEQRLFLARDRFGEKPLYWVRTENTFAFSSELRGLKALGLEHGWKLDPQSLAIFHVVGSVPAPRTIYRDVASLPPGCSLSVGRDGQVDIQTYWSLAGLANQHFQGTQLTEADARQECGLALTRAVESRMVSDVPVGLFLSGGLDSGSILATHAHLGLPPIDALSIDFPNVGFSEYALAQVSANACGARLHRRVVTPDTFLASMDGFFKAMDQPTTDGFNTYFVSRYGAELGIKVWLSGVGGDELFGGYPSFHRIGAVRGLGRVLQKVMPGIVADLAATQWPKRPRISRLCQLSDSGDVNKRAYQCLRNQVPWRNAKTLFAKGVWGSDWNFSKTLDALYPTLPDDCDSFTLASTMESNVYMASQLLRDIDNCSMAHSIELRAPFLDHRLAELTFAYPMAFKRQPGELKPLLVRSLPRPLPDELLRQPKRGFAFPLEIWMRDTMAESFNDCVLASKHEGMWDLTELRRIWKGHMEGSVHWSVPWTFYSMARWMQASNESL